MNAGDIRVRGLDSIREWLSKDDRYISMIGECEIIRDAVATLRRRTIGEGEEEEEEEEGVSVREKNGILGILLEMVEVGGWRGGYEELEEVVGRLEEEGEKEWRERKGKREGRGGDGEMISLRGTMKNLEEEKKGREEEKKRADEERRMKEEERKKVDEEKRRGAEEKRMKEEAERREAEEKRMKEEEERRAGEMEERIRNLEHELYLLKHPPITSLDGTSLTFPQNNGIKREGNTIIHHGSYSFRNCFIGGEMRSV